MRLAVVAPPWYPVPPHAYGGIEVVVALLVDGLTARGHDVTLVTVGQPGTRAARTLCSYREPQGPRIGQALPEVVHAAFAARVVAGLDVDLVHDHTTAGPLSAAGRAVPTVVTAHNDVTGEPGTVLAQLGDAVSLVAISGAQRRLAPHLPWAGTVHNGVDVDAFPFSADKDDYVLFLGRMSPQKAPHAAIDAARAAGRRILVAGKCVEPHEQRYFDEQVAPRLGPGVEWVGETGGEAKLQLLSRAAALVLPIAWEEPFGMVMLEAMACGTPVVTCARGAAPEVVVDGVTGFVTRCGTELAAAVAAVGELDPARCRRHVEQTFSADAMVSGYERVYAEVLEHAGRTVPHRPPVPGPRDVRP